MCTHRIHRQPNQITKWIVNADVKWVHSRRQTVLKCHELTFEDGECSFGWNGITYTIFSDTLIRRIISSGSYWFNTQYRLSVDLLHRISALCSWYFLAIFTPDDCRNWVASGSAEKTGHASHSNGLINRSFRYFRGIYEWDRQKEKQLAHLTKNTLNWFRTIITSRAM